VKDWYDCIAKKTNITSISDVFCQARVSGDNTQSVKPSSFAPMQMSAPRKGSVFLLFLVSTLLIGTTTAKIIPTMADNLVARQSGPRTTCAIQVARDFTAVRNESLTVSSSMGCGASNPCAIGINIDSGIANNNRTINGSSAAEARFDNFFTLLSDRTGHAFPAMSSIELYYNFLGPAGLFHITFTPTLVSNAS
jgi:hypothetical protein